MRKLLNRKITAQNGICGICKEKFTDYSDVVPDHIGPRGMGGAWRDAPRQHSGRALAVQQRERIEPRVKKSETWKMGTWNGENTLCHQ
jgi:hypothetical protein